MAKNKLPEAKEGKWIQKAVNPKHKGYCTPMTKKTCTPKRKALAKTFKKHHGFHEDGGAVPMMQDPNALPPIQGGQVPNPQEQQQVMQQMMQMVMQALQQGQPPEQVMQMLVQQGVPQEVAQQVIQMVMQQSQGGQAAPEQMGQDPNQQMPVMRYGGLPKAANTAQVVGLGTPVGQPDQHYSYSGPTQGQNGGFAGLAQGISSTAPTTQQPAQTVMPAFQQQQSPDLMPLAPQLMSGQTEFNKDYKYVPNKVTGKTPYYGPLSNYGHMYNGLSNLRENERIAADPNSTPEQIEAAKRGEKWSGVEFGFGLGNQITGDIKSSLGVGSKLWADNRDAKENFAIGMHKRINEDENNAIKYSNRLGKGQLRQGEGLPYSKYGRRLPKYGAGGMPTEGTDFQSSDPNVMTERGEVISEPNQGPIGPDGNPTGVVVHDKTGDSHSDPSGGNAYKLGPDSVIHSKSLAVKVGLFVEYAAQFPDASYIIGKVQEKFPNPEKEVTFAQLAALFDTKKLIKEVEKIAKKADKVEEASKGNEKTQLTKTTAKLNKETLANKLSDKHEQLAQNTEATGPNGPIFNLAETLKHQGAYGEDVKRDAQNPDTTPVAKYGKKVRLPKYVIPKAGTGKMINGVWVEDDPEANSVPKETFMLAPEPSSDPYPVLPPIDLNQKKAENSVYDLRYNPQVADPDINANILEGVSTNSGASSLEEKFLNNRLRTVPFKTGVTPSLPDSQETTTVRQANEVTPLVPPTSTTQSTGITPAIRRGLQNLMAPGSKVRVDQKERGFLDGFSAGQLEAFTNVLTGPNSTFKVPYGSWEEALKHPDELKQAIQKEAYKDPGINRAIWDSLSPTNKGAFGLLKNNPKYPLGVNTPADQIDDEDLAAMLNDMHLGIRTGKALQYSNQQKPEDTKPTEKLPFNPAVRQWSDIPADEKTPGFWGQPLNPLQVASPLYMMMQAKQGIPLIQSHGNQNAAQASVEERPTDIQAQLNRIGRARRAQTNHLGATPVAQAQAAQAYANQYSAEEQPQEYKYNADKGIHQQAMQLRNQYMAAAGQDKAAALDKLLERTATRDWKDTAAFANSVGTIGHDWMKQFLNNAQVGAVADMYGGASVTPWGTTHLDYSGALPLIGAANPNVETSRDVKTDALGNETTTIHYKNGATHTITTPKKGMGGKVKRLPKKLPK